MPLRCAVSAEYRGFWVIYGCGQMGVMGKPGSRERGDGATPPPVGKNSAVDYLPMQKLEKIRPSRSSGVKAPVISPNACWA